jgi:simple sugar transport system permease protein
MGIAVALLGKNTPLGVLLAALLFGVLNTGALEIDVFTDVPRELILVLQAVTIILVVVGNEVFARRTAARERRAAGEAAREAAGGGGGPAPSTEGGSGDV